MTCFFPFEIPTAKLALLIRVQRVVWCSVVWCGVVWCGVVWCGVVWCGVVCGVVWCDVVWCGELSSCCCCSHLYVAAFTHSYGQNQRYVPLQFAQSNAFVTASLPPLPVVIPGPYHLFLVSADGKPSRSYPVIVRG
jgi:hypothetical protein